MRAEEILFMDGRVGHDCCYPMGLPRHSRASVHDESKSVETVYASLHAPSFSVDAEQQRARQVSSLGPSWGVMSDE